MRAFRALAPRSSGRRVADRSGRVARPTHFSNARLANLRSKKGSADVSSAAPNAFGASCRGRPVSRSDPTHRKVRHRNVTKNCPKKMPPPFDKFRLRVIFLFIEGVGPGNVRTTVINMHIDLATKVCSEMLDIGTRLNGNLRSIKDGCPDEEFKRYRMGFANAKASIFLEILEPIFNEHPSLEPRYLKRDAPRRK